MVKSLSQISSERYLLIGILKEWVSFGKSAQYKPPKEYYNSLGQLTKKSESTISFCITDRHQEVIIPPAEQAQKRTRERVER
jgi:hypothetical protein